MSPVIRITPAADRDTDRHWDFLARSGAAVARRFLAALRRSYDGLAQFPRLGSLWDTDEEAFEGLRLSAVDGFPNPLIFYRPLDGPVAGIEVIRVLHAAQDIEAIFGGTG